LKSSPNIITIVTSRRTSWERDMQERVGEEKHMQNFAQTPEEKATRKTLI